MAKVKSTTRSSERPVRERPTMINITEVAETNAMIERENLDLLQKDEDWLLRELRARGLASPKQVSYMNVDELGNIFLQEKESE